MKLLLLPLLLVFLGLCGGQQQYPRGLCSINTSIFNTTACIQAIKARASNENLFWYGTPFELRCPPGKQETISCLTFHDKRPRTLAQALLTQDFPDLSKLDRLVNVVFTSGPGEYTGCDTSYKRDSTIQFAVNPLSTKTYKPWDMRSFPKVTWSVNPDRSDQYYTWIMYDAGFRISHSIYMNIRGNDFSRASVIQEFGGPLNTRFIPNTYTFSIWKQPGYITPPMNKPNPNFFDVSAFARRYRLEGPVALTWLLASTDAYAIGKMKDINFMNNCPVLIEQAYNTDDQIQKRSFLPFPLADLTVDMSLKYDSPAFTYECDNANYSLPEASFTIDPVGMKVYKPAFVRTETDRLLTLSLRKLSPKPSELNGKCFMLLMVDPDVPKPMSLVTGGKDRPIAHMLVTDLRKTNGRQTSANMVLPYLGPAPPDELPHFYDFMLYDDPNCRRDVDPSLYTGPNCPAFVKDRCFFDIEKFVSDLDLKLAGVMWMKVEIDHFTECFYNTASITKSTTLAWTIIMPVVFLNFFH